MLVCSSNLKVALKIDLETKLSQEERDMSVLRILANMLWFCAHLYSFWTNILPNSKKWALSLGIVLARRVI